MGETFSSGEQKQGDIFPLYRHTSGISIKEGAEWIKLREAVVLKPDQRNVTKNIFGKCKLKGVSSRATRVRENSANEE